MKRAMRENPTEDPRVIFDRQSGPGAVLLEFPGNERTLQNIKNEANPPIPKSVDQVVEALQRSQYSPLLKDVAWYNNHLALLWWPDEVEEMIQQVEVTEVSMDATFRCVPPLFGKNKQHFTILGLFPRVGTPQHNWLPLITVTMQCKLEGLYSAVLDKIWCRLTSLRPALIHCDFERGLMNAIEAVCEGGCVSGCWFHHNQAVKRKVGGEGLIAVGNQNRKVKDWARNFYPLPLLPPDKMRDGWEWVRLEMGPVLQTLTEPQVAACLEVLDYYDRHVCVCLNDAY